MKRIKIWLLAVLLWGVLSGCGSSQAPAVQVLNLTEDPLTDAQAVALQTQALETAAEYRDFLLALEPGQTANLALSQEQTAQLAARFADAGLTVIDGDNALNMENPAPAMAFGQAVREERDAVVTIYRVYRDGGFARTELEYRDGAAYLTNIRIVWDAALQPRVSSISRRDVLALRYTEKGYLIWRTRELDSVESAPDYVPYQMIRVAPLDEQCRTLCQRYIRPVGYANSNLFLTDWTVTDPGELVWNDVFPACYFLKTGVLLTSHTCGDYTFDAQAGLLVPEEDYVRYIGDYFPVEPEALTAGSYRDPASGCYPTRLFTSGDMAQRLPTPEVVDWEENEDGSLTLTVEALDLEWGTDCAFRHLVTVLPQADGGWKYLGNQMVPGADDHLPVYQNTYATAG